MADQPVTLVDYDPSWPQRFREQQQELTRLLRPWLAGSPEHVGSTAVPGLRAKPVIDILAPVFSLAAAQDAVAVLAEHGWLFWAEDPNRFYRLWFLRPDPAARTHHLHIMQHDHPERRRVLLFRDALRNDPALRQAYAALKERVAEQHRTDRDAYTEAKSDFIRTSLEARGGTAPVRQPIHGNGRTTP